MRKRKRVVDTSARQGLSPVDNFRADNLWWNLYLQGRERRLDEKVIKLWKRLDRSQWRLRSKNLQNKTIWRWNEDRYSLKTTCLQFCSHLRKTKFMCLLKNKTTFFCHFLKKEKRSIVAKWDRIFPVRSKKKFLESWWSSPSKLVN